MKIETEPRDDHQTRIVAEFEPELLEKFKQQAARKISREAKIPGFRPGKAPFSVVRRMFGDDAIQQQAVEMMVDDVYPQILKESGIEPAYPGALEEIISTDPPKFAFIIPLKPEVVLSDYHALRSDYLPEAVTEQEVENYLKRVRTSYSTAEPVERPTQDGDLVYAKVTGTLTTPDEDQEAEFIHETPMQTVIGDSTISPDNWPYPGFSKELVGMAEKEEKDVTYVYPEDAESEKVRGKEITFHIVVMSIKALTVPELDDEFVKTLGDFDSVETFTTSTRTTLEENKRQAYEREYFDKLINEITDGATVHYPPQMLEEEQEQVLHNIEHNLADQNLDLDTYLKVMNLDREAFIEKEVRPTAERRIARSLVMDQIAHEEKIRLEDGELQAAFDETIAEIRSSGELQQMQGKIEQDRLANAIAYEAANRAMNRRVFQRLKEIATGQADAVPAESEAEVAPQPETVETSEETGSEPTSTAEIPAENAPEE